MANHKSAKKRIRVSERRRIINKSSLSRLKTLTNKVLESEKKEEVAVLYKDAVAFIDKMVAKGRIHRNTAARRKSALTLYKNKLEKA